jgi:hypothetical protein
MLMAASFLTGTCLTAETKENATKTYAFEGNRIEIHFRLVADFVSLIS